MSGQKKVPPLPGTRGSPPPLRRSALPPASLAHSSLTSRIALGLAVGVFSAVGILGITLLAVSFTRGRRASSPEIVDATPVAGGTGAGAAPRTAPAGDGQATSATALRSAALDNQGARSPSTAVGSGDAAETALGGSSPRAASPEESKTAPPTTVADGATPRRATESATTGENQAAGAPGNAAPGNAAPGNAAPGNAAPGNAAPGSAAPGSAAPGSAAPGSAAPGSAAPGNAAPGSAAPAADRAVAENAPPAPGGVTAGGAEAGKPVARVWDLPAIGGLVSAKPVEPLRLEVASAADCSLALLGMKVAFGEEYEVNLTDAGSTAAERRWEVNVRSNDAQTVIGEFLLREQNLTFQWKRNRVSHPAAGRLRYCLLGVTVGGRQQLYALTRSMEAEPAKLELLVPKARVELPLTMSELPAVEHLLLEVRMEQVPRHQIEPTGGIREGETGKVSVFGEQAGDDPLLVLNLSFRPEQRPGIEWKCRGLVPDVMGGAPTEEEITQVRLTSLRKEYKEADDKKEKERQELTKDSRLLAQEINRLKAEKLRTLNRQQNEVFEQEIERRQMRETEMRDRLREIDAERKQLERVDQWRMEFQRLLARLAKSGKLHYRLFVTMEEGRVEVARTRQATP